MRTRPRRSTATGWTPVLMAALRRHGGRLTRHPDPTPPSRGRRAAAKRAAARAAWRHTPIRESACGELRLADYRVSSQWLLLYGGNVLTNTIRITVAAK